MRGRLAVVAALALMLALVAGLGGPRERQRQHDREQRHESFHSRDLHLWNALNPALRVPSGWEQCAELHYPAQLLNLALLILARGPAFSTAAASEARAVQPARRSRDRHARLRVFVNRP